MVPFKAMTFPEVASTDVELIDDYLARPHLVVQQKLDGVRVLAYVSPGAEGGPVRVQLRQRDGRELKFAAARQWSERVMAAIIELHNERPSGMASTYVLDGELIVETGKYFMFDYLSEQLLDEQAPYLARYAELCRYMPEHRYYDETAPIAVVGAWPGSSGREALDAAHRHGVEGLILRDGREPYVYGRSTLSAKVKLVHELDAVVIERTVEPDSALLGLWSFEVTPRGVSRECIPVGRVSARGKGELPIGSVVTVRYLYWGGAALVQPRVVRERTDKAGSECSIGQVVAYSREILPIGYLPTEAELRERREQDAIDYYGHGHSARM